MIAPLFAMLGQSNSVIEKELSYTIAMSHACQKYKV